jgi:hypothetical protein
MKEGARVAQLPKSLDLIAHTSLSPIQRGFAPGFVNCKKGVFNATFSNISAISWRPVLVVEEAGVHGENHRPCASNW